MRRFVVFLSVLAIVTVWISKSASTANTTLVALGSQWKYLDNGSNQGTAWRAVGFPDGGWAAGNAQLGYGDGDEATTVGYGPDPNNKYVTTYFRQTFNVADPSLFQNLSLSILRDDGAVVYLNGTEVFRTGMPTGTIAFNTLASGQIEDTTYYSASISTALLQAGTNVLAVEIHQGGPTSTDISFDAQLVASTSALQLTRGP